MSDCAVIWNELSIEIFDDVLLESEFLSTFNLYLYI